MVEPLPERIGAYRVVSLLGRGGMGEVFLAWDDRLKRRVAIKRIRTDKGLSPAMRQRLLREARAVASVSHPSVVQLYDLIESEDGDCLVLEYVEGKTLTAVLSAGGPLEPATAVRLAREIAEGLAAAHAAGIVHRDLKTENVIVTPEGHAKILDFGLAQMRAFTDDVVITQHGAVLGTFHTMSPEQAGGGKADERSDLFSLGVLLYEALTGRSPFRGANPLETLRRVISEHPPRADGLRPEVPAPLAELTEHLLAKDPASRPLSAAETARRLRAIESSPGLESVSDLPTAEVALPRSPSAPDSTTGLSIARGRQAWWLAVALAAVVLLGISGLLLHRTAEETLRDKPFRVAVPQPAVNGGDERLALAASGVLSAILDSLASLEGMAPIDPLQLVGAPETPVEMAKAVAADEVLVASLEKSGHLGRVTLRRIDGKEGRVLWTATFEAPIEPRDLRLLADAVGIHVRRGFPEARPRPGTPVLDVRNEDYAEYLEIKRLIDSGKVLADPELERLERIARNSPRFLEAWLLAADVAHSRFRSSREIADFNRALALVRRAEELAPGDPRPLQKRFKIELAGDQPGVARATLTRLENLLPGDPQVLVQRAELAEREGRNVEALTFLRTAVERVPSWRNLYRLAGLEFRNGRIADARQHLEALLEISPGNVWGLEDLAIIELLTGDLKRAERIYRDLADRSPQRAYFTNLGLVRIFLGRYEEAIAAFHQALALDPAHVNTTVNLADAELVLGRKREAEAHYREALERLERNRPPGGLSPEDSLTQAQCLAHLGRTLEAVETAQEALRQRPEDPQLLQAAALVYTLVGDRASALVSIQEALEQGVQPRWFTYPAFSSLHNDPEFRELLRQKH